MIRRCLADLLRHWYVMYIRGCPYAHFMINFAEKNLFLFAWWVIICCIDAPIWYYWKLHCCVIRMVSWHDKGQSTRHQVTFAEIIIKLPLLRIISIQTALSLWYLFDDEWFEIIIVAGADVDEHHFSEWIAPNCKKGFFSKDNRSQ